MRRLSRKYRRRYPTIDYQEVEAIGFEGLALAALRFDPARGVPFAGFAQKRVEGHLSRELTRLVVGVSTATRLTASADHEAVATPEAVAIDREILDRLLRAVVDLPREAQHLIRRRYVDGAPMSAIAGELACSRDTLYRRLSSLHLHLRERVLELPKKTLRNNR